MKILIGTYPLAAGARDSDEEAETVATLLADVVPGVRAQNVAVWKRGNRAYQFVFTKTREHGDFKAAERFRLLHPTEIPTAGYLQFITEDGAGTEASVWFLNHNIDQVRIRQIGVGTITTYTITASQPTATRPS